MALATMLKVDHKPSAMDSWQLLKSPTGLQTAATAAILATPVRTAAFAQAGWEFIDVSLFDAIRVQVWGVGSATNGPILNLYGWNDTGPGSVIGILTGTMGTFTHDLGGIDKIHKSISGAFTPGTSYRNCDAFGTLTDYELEAGPAFKAVSLMAAPLDNYPAHFIIDFARSQYKFLVVAVTNLGSATSAGAIFRPIRLRSRFASPTGLG